MGKSSFSSKVAKFFRRKSSVSANKKTDDTSVKMSAAVLPENPPISEIVVVTEISRGLGRRVPYRNDDTFSGIVNIHYVYDARRYSAFSLPKRSNCSQDIGKEKKAPEVKQQRNREESRSLENVESKARSD